MHPRMAGKRVATDLQWYDDDDDDDEAFFVADVFWNSRISYGLGKMMMIKTMTCPLWGAPTKAKTCPRLKKMPPPRKSAPRFRPKIIVSYLSYIFPLSFWFFAPTKAKKCPWNISLPSLFHLSIEYMRFCFGINRERANYKPLQMNMQASFFPGSSGGTGALSHPQWNNYISRFLFKLNLLLLPWSALLKLWCIQGWLANV